MQSEMKQVEFETERQSYRRAMKFNADGTVADWLAEVR